MNGKTIHPLFEFCLWVAAAFAFGFGLWYTYNAWRPAAKPAAQTQTRGRAEPNTPDGSLAAQGPDAAAQPGETGEAAPFARLNIEQRERLWILDAADLAEICSRKEMFALGEVPLERRRQELLKLLRQELSKRDEELQYAFNHTKDPSAQQWEFEHAKDIRRRIEERARDFRAATATPDETALEQLYRMDKPLLQKLVPPDEFALLEKETNPQRRFEKQLYMEYFAQLRRQEDWEKGKFSVDSKRRKETWESFQNGLRLRRELGAHRQPFLQKAAEEAAARAADFKKRAAQHDAQAQRHWQEDYSDLQHLLSPNRLKILEKMIPFTRTPLQLSLEQAAVKEREQRLEQARQKVPQDPAEIKRLEEDLANANRARERIRARRKAYAEADAAADAQTSPAAAL